MAKDRISNIIKQLKEYNSVDRTGKKYHAWKTIISPEHMSNEYLGVVEYVGITGNIFTPFSIKLNNGKNDVASTIDFFTDINEQPFLWLK
jgi:hypothetical protein